MTKDSIIQKRILSLLSYIYNQEYRNTRTAMHNCKVFYHANVFAAQLIIAKRWIDMRRAKGNTLDTQNIVGKICIYYPKTIQHKDVNDLLHRLFNNTDPIDAIDELRNMFYAMVRLLNNVEITNLITEDQRQLELCTILETALDLQGLQNGSTNQYA